MHCHTVDFNGHNALVVGTGDMSELALGFATYNGDHMSMYGASPPEIPSTARDIPVWIRRFFNPIA